MRRILQFIVRFFEVEPVFGGHSRFIA